MNITIHGLDELKASLGKYAKNLPYVLSRALNDTVYGARQAAIAEIKDVFDRPTPVVQRGVLYTKSDKRNLSASVYIDDGSKSSVDVAAILVPHVYGGGRVLKASERRLRRFGFMGPDQWLVPGPGAPLDQYGNIPASVMSNILGQIQAYQEAGYNKRKQRKSRAVGTVYWIPRVGIFKRTGPQSSIPILFFANKKPAYEAGRFNFHNAVLSYFEKHFPDNFAKHLADALKRTQ